MKAKNWKEYIKEKFGDEKKFRILNLDEDFVEIRSTDSFIETVIEFVFADNLEDLEGVSFWGSDEKICGYWSAHFNQQEEPMFKSFKLNIMPSPLSDTILRFFPFTPEFIQKLESKWLAIPLEQGWREDNILVGDFLYQSQLNSRIEGCLDFKIIQYGMPNLKAKFKKIINMDVKNETLKFKPILL